ncbi:uncharacterized protein N7469_011330 [Penicillium citrinum]|uniref:Uncharacterized protein n=1 Tax=Penicillium citrinum TaxID=5077 RepID=A0A9W9ND84_PENCI|nr:uncharacterized protein N7469_011330 [Penicillium citrinum]KAJ5217705.1 hypothetical protein N7469_011330 [Penicillium citrinum]
MVPVSRSALGPSGPLDILTGLTSPGGGSSVAGSSGGAWSNTTTIHTNDPASGRNESRVITESGHDHTVRTDLAVWASVGAFVSVAVFVGGAVGVDPVSNFHGRRFSPDSNSRFPARFDNANCQNRRNRRSARTVALTLARINNPEGAAAERAAEDLEAARRAAKPRRGLLPLAGRWLRRLLWDGFPKS